MQIEQRQVRALTLNCRDGFGTGFRFSDDDDVFERAEQSRQERSRRPFVVGDDDSKTCVHEAFLAAVASALVKSAGIRISTVVPTPGSLTIERVAAAPYR